MATRSRPSKVEKLLEELRAHGAEVTLPKKRPTAASIAAAEKKLGFALPAEYVAFLKEIGGIEIELERTWFFYGLEGALEMTREYAKVFDESPKGNNYLPKRFIVLHDEGDFSNQASGTVYDADLKKGIVTQGSRWLEREDAFPLKYDAWLVEKLEEIRDRITDEDDILVAGGARDLARQEAERAAAPVTSSLEEAKRALAECNERLYAHYADRPKPAKFLCGEKCRDCAKFNKALSKRPLRELDALELEHYAYWGLNPNNEFPSTPKARKVAYEHFLPRILEILGPIGSTGNRTVVIPVITRAVSEIVSGEARKLVTAQLLAAWTVELETAPPEEKVFNSPIEARLKAFAQWDASLADALAIWDARALPGTAPSAHLRIELDEFLFDKPADYYGWQPEPFQLYKAFLERHRVD